MKTKGSRKARAATGQLRLHLAKPPALV